jgi:hypothetical protein
MISDNDLYVCIADSFSGKTREVSSLISVLSLLSENRTVLSCQK